MPNDLELLQKGKKFEGHKKPRKTNLHLLNKKPVHSARTSEEKGVATGGEKSKKPSP